MQNAPSRRGAEAAPAAPDNIIMAATFFKFQYEFFPEMEQEFVTRYMDVVYSHIFELNFTPNETESFMSIFLELSAGIESVEANILRAHQEPHSSSSDELSVMSPEMQVTTLFNTQVNKGLLNLGKHYAIQGRAQYKKMVQTQKDVEYFLNKHSPHLSQIEALPDFLKDTAKLMNFMRDNILMTFFVASCLVVKTQYPTASNIETVVDSTRSLSTMIESHHNSIAYVPKSMDIMALTPKKNHALILEEVVLAQRLLVENILALSPKVPEEKYVIEFLGNIPGVAKDIEMNDIEMNDIDPLCLLMKIAKIQDPTRDGASHVVMEAETAPSTIAPRPTSRAIFHQATKGTSSGDQSTGGDYLGTERSQPKLPVLDLAGLNDICFKIRKPNSKATLNCTRLVMGLLRAFSGKDPVPAPTHPSHDHTRWASVFSENQINTSIMRHDCQFVGELQSLGITLKPTITINLDAETEMTEHASHLNSSDIGQLSQAIMDSIDKSMPAFGFIAMVPQLTRLKQEDGTVRYFPGHMISWYFNCDQLFFIDLQCDPGSQIMQQKEFMSYFTSAQETLGWSPRVYWLPTTPQQLEFRYNIDSDESAQPAVAR